MESDDRVAKKGKNGYDEPGWLVTTTERRVGLAEDKKGRRKREGWQRTVVNVVLGAPPS